jgi:hypothetical protein
MRRFFSKGLSVFSSLLHAYTIIPAGSVMVGPKPAGTYYVEGNVTVPPGEILILEGGVILKFAEGSGLNVQGFLDINIIMGGQVYFTSIHDNSIGETISGSTGNPQPGDWIGVYVWPGPATFESCVLRYGGGGGFNGYDSNLKFHTGSHGQFINSISEYSLTHGLYADGAADLEITGSTFSHNGGSTYDGVYMNSSVADLTNNTMNSNGGFGAYIRNGTAGTYTGNTGSDNGADAFAVAALQVNTNLSWSASDAFPIRLYKPDGGYSHSVTVAEGNTLTFAAGTFQIDHPVTINGAGNFALSSGATLELKGIVEYEWTNGINDQLTLSGTKTLDPGANYIFSGNAAQVSGSEFPAAVNNLTLNNSTGLTLSSGITVGGTLNLVSGNLTTGSNTLTVGISASSVGSISRTEGTVVGNLQRWIAASVASDILFPIGTADDYRPVNLSYTSAPSTGGTILSGFTASDPGTNGVDLSSEPVRDGSFNVKSCYPDGFWTLTSGNGLSGGAYSLDVTADGFTGISDYTSLHLLKRSNSGSNWTVDGTHITATGSNDIPVLHRTGMSAFSEFGVGDGEPVPPISLTATGGTTAATYNTLKEAFDAINAGSHTGDISILIESNVTETSSPILNASGSGSASYSSVLIRPGTSGVSISGAVSTMIYLNGADNVTIDGQVGGNSGTKDLTIHNTSEASSSNKTLYFYDACNNTVKYVIMQGKAPSSSAISINNGLVHFGGGSVTGNDNNTIDHCDIDGQGNTSACIYSKNPNGSTPDNNGNTISNCNIYDFYAGTTYRYHSGIHMDGWGNGSWTVTGNSLYQTASRTFADNDYCTMYGIHVDIAGTCTVSNNYVGGSEPECGGSAWTHSGGRGSLFCIDLYGVTASDVSNIDGNTIKNISVYHSGENATLFLGIRALYGNIRIGTNTGNIIGSSQSNDVITLNSPYNSYARGITYNSGDAAATIRNNTIGGLTFYYYGEFYGIYNASSNAGTHLISDNLVGSLTQSNSIRGANNSWGITLNGIYSNAAGGSTTVSNNTIANLSYPYASTNTRIRGLNINDRGGSVSGNTIYNLSMSAGSTSSGDNNALSGIYAVYSNNPNNVSISDNDIYALSATHESDAVETNGIYYKNTGAGCTIDKNHIYNISQSTSNTASVINGIQMISGPVSVINNMVSLGSGIANAMNIRGVADASSSANTVCFNSVRIGGTVTGTAGSTYSQAFFRSITAADDIRGNIFANMRSNDGSTQKHYAVNLNSHESLTQNYNLLYASGSGGYIGTTDNGTNSYSNLGDWQTAASLDAQSLSGDPLFHTLNDLHVLPPSPASNMGQPVSGISTDFYGNVRSESTPDAGAVEFIGQDATTSGNFSNPVAETENTIISLDAAGGVTFNPSLDISGGVTGYYFSDGRSGELPDGVTNMSPYYWTLSTDVESFTGTLRLYFDKINGNGIGSPETLQLLRRNNEQGEWEIHADVTRSSTYIQANSLAGFSEFALGGNNDNSLPVTLSAFTAKNLKGTVVLEWKTSAEIENQGFILSREERGTRNERDRFETCPEIIASFATDDALKGQGSTTETTKYLYVDKTVEPGKTYVYTLVDVDYSGNETILKKVEVQVKTEETIVAEGYVLDPVYPNPFNATLTVPFTLSEPMHVSIDLYSLTGRHVLTAVNREFTIGSYLYTIKTPDLSSGIYLIQTSFGGKKKYLQKAILLK